MDAEQPSFNWDELRRDIADAMRYVIRKLAAERGMSHDDYLDWLANNPLIRRK